MKQESVFIDEKNMRVSPVTLVPIIRLSQHEHKVNVCQKEWETGTEPPNIPHMTSCGTNYAPDLSRIDFIAKKYPGIGGLQPDTAPIISSATTVITV